MESRASPQQRAAPATPPAGGPPRPAPARRPGDRAAGGRPRDGGRWAGLPVLLRVRGARAAAAAAV